MWPATLLLPQTGQRVQLLVPRVLHPVRMQNRIGRAAAPGTFRSRYPGYFYWYDLLRLRVIPYQRKANDEWPLEHLIIDPIHGAGFESIELEDIVGTHGITGRDHRQEWTWQINHWTRKESRWEKVQEWRGDVSPAVRQLVDQLSAISTGPTDPNHVTPPIAVVKRVSFMRSSSMTSILKESSQKQLKYANIPPANPEVAAIMAEKKVGRKRAYDIVRQRRLATLNGEVPQTQRVQVLAALAEHGGQSKNAMVLLETVHGDGFSIDMHDVVKTLWSLQKNRFVNFRERNNPPGLYAIKLTDAGFKAYSDMKESVSTPVVPEITEEEAAWMNAPMGPVVTNVGPDQQNAAHDLALQHAQEVAQRAAAAQMTINALGAGKPSNFDFDRLPLMKAIRDRARKEAVLAQAAALLEEAGEDDIAVLVMEQTKYNELELEVKTMLAALGEI